ncbi:MAG: phosphonate metabolism protein/1,5-bisphosphokinase (PRPP-forming) PhnN, partial [Flavobacteriaceae bacterium]|nr:phosphonate metabolism protein/1,5-bisphosphokinase (PRPP-forming) PhnN [Flavobacteriaceae bacterium]
FIVIHVTASPETLTQRLSARGRETLDQICNRLKRANFEIAEGITVRTVLNDGSLDQAIADFNDALYPSN